ncbi:MAG: hypothetical protein ABI321_04880 [Polyangia bacterium]
MPLHDLSAGRPSVGAALRETLTVDLGHTPGVHVVEREVIDRVLREQSVDPGRVLEGVLGVRVGTLLGASHLVTGAYQREKDRLRVTARVVDVATGAIVGTAKVDGSLDRLLELEDQLSVALLASTGWKGAIPKRTRPRVAPRSIERYGDAVLEPDVGKKKALLAESIAQTPQFSYAVDALAALEGRLGTYEVAHAVTLTAREQALLDAAKDSRQRVAKVTELLALQKAARRYHALLATCDAFAAPAEPIAYHRFVALDGLRLIDEALAAGEALLKSYPDSPHFAEVGKRLREVADVKRTQLSRRSDYEHDLAKKAAAKGMEHDFAPCIVARWNRQYSALMVDGCRAYIAAQGSSTEPLAKEHARHARLFTILALGELGRFDEARHAIAEFRARYPEGDAEIDEKLAIWPTD